LGVIWQFFNLIINQVAVFVIKVGFDGFLEHFFILRHYFVCEVVSGELAVVRESDDSWGIVLIQPFVESDGILFHLCLYFV
jgi:hypothetical protein